MNAILSRLPASSTGRAAVVGFRVAAAGLLLPIGLIHLHLAPIYALGATYIGDLFYATFVATLLAATGIVLGLRGAWILGLLTSLGALAGLVAASTIGLPNFTDSFTAPHATQSLTLEAAFAVLFVVAARLRPSAVLATRPARREMAQSTR